MVIIELTYVKPLSEVEKLLDQHVMFLNKYYEQKIFIASGRKVPRDGGIILALTDKDGASKLIHDDPFYQEKIAEYRLTEFIPSKYHDCFAKILT